MKDKSSSNCSKTKERNRDPLFDNIKALLLFLVALGHSLDMYRQGNVSDDIVMKYLYLFHMPFFAFITGYFSKDFARARTSAVRFVLVPYLVFQSIYVLLGTLMIRLGVAKFNADIFKPSILIPTSAFYYLIAVFFWKSMVGIFKLRYPIALSIAAGLLVSTTQETSFHIGYAAVFSLLPFFVLGVRCDHAKVERIRSLPRWAAMAVLVLGIPLAACLPYSIHNIRMTYASTGMSNLTGMGYRILFYAIATAMSIAVLNLMPARRFGFTRIGEASLLVYCISTILSPHAYRLIEMVFGIPKSGLLHWLSLLLFCVAVVYGASLSVFRRLLASFVSMVCKIVSKE
ncbi:MAG: acyltransferase family protein [Kiritimatiellae bacterium]|nr:acyltransferase family protein [Kiritimatiellia bacterium]